MQTLPLVSVIITTRNEEKHIENCLKSVQNQTYPIGKIEIIVVDNASIDKTKDLSRKFTSKVYDCGPERSAQRNFGINQAQGEYILYLDADMVLSKDVIFESVAKCQSQNLVALYIPEQVADLSSNQIDNLRNHFWIKVRAFERSFYNATCIDAVRFIKKDVALGIGGFDESLTGPEDWDFDRRIKQSGAVDIIEVPLYHNEGTFNFKEYLNKKTYYLKSFDKYIEKWGKDDKVIKKQLGFRYRYFGVFIEKGKWVKLLKHPVMSFSMYFLRIIVGAAILCSKKPGGTYEAK